MKTHSQIIRSVGADQVLQRTGLGVSVHTVRSWGQRNGIPGEYWAAIADAGIASLKELASAADARAANDAAPQQAAA